MTIISCVSSDKRTGNWREEYIKQEKSRIVTIRKTYKFNSGHYSLENIDSTFKTFDEKGQLIGSDDRHFYKYDSSGKIIAEEYCMRTCERPGKIIYFYDNLNRLTKTVVVTSKDNERVAARYYYDDRNLLTKKVIGNDSIPTTETYTYDGLARMTSKTTREYNTNVNKWLTFVDSMFFDTNNNVILKKRRHIGEDLLTLSKFTYKDTLLMIQVDTTITSIPGYLPAPETILHAYYFRIDYKYDSNSRIIEKVTTQPDYKTPFRKVMYEYK